jgi:hypothetical protein
VTPLSDRETRLLRSLAAALVSQEEARIIVAPKKREPGFWFGSGGLVEDSQGTLYLSGRYRNYGDSRTGLHAGERGLELAIFRSNDGGSTFEKVSTFSKADLSHGDHEVVSIEGSALRLIPGGVELYVSTEKRGYGYPPGLESFQKEGTGKWTIDRVTGSTPEQLDLTTINTVLESSDPRYLHLKDPVVSNHRGTPHLVLCTHPFNWASSNSAIAAMREDGLGEPDFTFFPRGFTWDVGISRITGVTPVPNVGAFADRNDVALIFYDGGESMRNLDEHKQAVTRPRGYSCEELGGLAAAGAADLSDIVRISTTLPEFVSPTGSGSSRYIQAFHTSHGLIALWQQSQSDFSQPLVMNRLSQARVEEILSQP